MRAAALFALAIAFALPLLAQDNYEIQVYGSDTVARGATMFELHSNYTARGIRESVDRVLPSNHAIHETLEITHGFNDWFETGFYVFTSEGQGLAPQYVGSHIRPRVRVPDSWQWPVGVSLSTEAGYVRRAYSADTWSWELRPIVDKQIGPWYLAANPALEKSLHGANAARGFEFAPAAAVKYEVNKTLTAGLEYYGGLGPLSRFDPVRDQQQQLFPSIDLDLGPEWEFNAGIGFGLTKATDRLLVKVILGRRVGK